WADPSARIRRVLMPVCPASIASSSGARELEGAADMGELLGGDGAIGVRAEASVLAAGPGAERVTGAVHVADPSGSQAPGGSACPALYWWLIALDVRRTIVTSLWLDQQRERIP